MSVTARLAGVGPATRYARSGQVHIAHQVLGSGPPDLVLVPGFVSHVEAAWEAHVREGAPYHPQYRVVRADDKEIWVDGSVRYLLRDGATAQDLFRELGDTDAEVERFAVEAPNLAEIFVRAVAGDERARKVA